MDKFNWDNNTELDKAREFFDKFVITWNPLAKNQRNNTIFWSPHDDPWLLDMTKIFFVHPSEDYEELVNHVQRNRKCTKGTFLCKKGKIMECHYKAPWKKKPTSTLTCDSTRNKKYELAINEDKLNIHNQQMLQIWRANIDC